jgi:hypothetical protein
MVSLFVDGITQAPVSAPCGDLDGAFSISNVT